VYSHLLRSGAGAGQDIAAEELSSVGAELALCISRKKKRN